MFRRTFAALFAVLLAASTVSAQEKKLLAFPDAEGFGKYSVGGSGRHLKTPETTILRVINLDDKGKGSLRSAIEASGPRIIVFEVSGEIKLSDTLRIKNPYVTVAGQTAPAPGITLRGAGIRCEASEIIIQHLRIRVGDDPDGPKAESRDGIAVLGAHKNIVFDHCSVSWSVDELAGMGGGPSNVSFSHCIFAEALKKSIHPEGEHSMALLVGPKSTSISIAHSLYAHNVERAPARLQAGSSCEIYNNLVYDWVYSCNLADSGKEGGGLKVNFGGNYLKPTKDTKEVAQFSGKAHADTRVFVEKNYSPLRTKATEDEWAITKLAQGFQSKTPAFTGSGIKAKDPANTYDYVLANAGARPKERDAVDIRIVDEVKKGTGTFKNSVKDAGGWPELEQKTRAFEVPKDAPQAGQYTPVEKLLHQMAKELEPKR